MKNGERFLSDKYKDLSKSQEVQHEQERRELAAQKKQEAGTKVLKEEKPSSEPAKKIEHFLKIIAKTHGHHEDPRVLERIKSYYHKKYVIKPEDIRESYWDSQRQIIVEQGRSGDFVKGADGKIEIPEEIKQQQIEVILADQSSTLDNWVEYLSSPDANVYPTWAKYWAFRSMLTLSRFNKKAQEFERRSKGTTAPFLDLNREALAYVVDMIAKKVNKESMTQEDPELQKILQSENFGKLYAYAIEHVASTEEKDLRQTQGEWVKYDKGSDHMSLVDSLQGYGTGWCTASESTARAQLDMGDFYVYYSLNKEGKFKIPRVAIRMEEGKIVEVRGIAAYQNLDPYIDNVTKEKLKEFPDGAAYEKKARDMKWLTSIEGKIKYNQQLTNNDLAFLYEIYGPIEGFGYQKDPRIIELRSKRDYVEDMSVIFECTKEQIAQNQENINENTRAYVGTLKPGIFGKIRQYNIEHVYTEFPENRRILQRLKIGEKTSVELLQELQMNNINVYRPAKDMLNHSDFKIQKKPGVIDLARLTLRDLGFTFDKRDPTTEQIYTRAKELGLELCPAEVGPCLRLQYKNQPAHESIYICMKEIPSRGSLLSFRLLCSDNKLQLYASEIKPETEWNTYERDFSFIFCVPKLKP